MDPEESEFQIRCAGEDAAWTCGPREQALAEARHYAAIYSQDGPVEIYEIHKTYTLIQ